MSKVEILNAINPQISLTIGNAEIVNMLVQARVSKLKEKKAEIDQLLVTSALEMAAFYTGFRTQVQTDFTNVFEKKLQAFAKSYKELTGTKVTASPDDTIVGAASWSTDGFYVGLTEPQYNRRSGTWTTEDKVPKEQVFYVCFVETPTAKEIAAEMKESGADEERARKNCISHGESVLDFELKLPISKELEAVVLKAREVSNRRTALVRESREIDRLLADTSSVEKEVLAKMTQNTLQNNPELAQAFGVLANGLMQLDEAGLPALTVE